MYKCLDCGHIFDEGEEKTYKETHGDLMGPAEYWKGCPICGGAFEKTVRCENCGAEFLPDELYADKWCDECLKEMVTYENFLEYISCGAENDNECDLLEHFVITKIFNITEVPENSSYEFKKILREIYLRNVANDKLIGKGIFLKTIKEYVLEKECDKEDFAEWLVEREENND